MHCPFCLSSRMVLGSKHHDRRQRYQCQTCKRRTLHPLPDDSPALFGDDHEGPLPASGIYVFTGAQNNTRPAPIFYALKNYCEHRNAKLCVIKMRYKNPTSVGETLKAHSRHFFWDDEFKGVLYDGRHSVHKFLTLLGDAKVQLTAAHPTTGFESITGSKSVIIAHPKMELRSIPTPQEALPKLVMTTGACTIKNYSDSRAGIRGDFHHTYGALVVEIDGDTFHVRQLNALGNGKFMDIDLNEYSPDGIKPFERIEALDMGDTHVDVVDADVVAATFTNNDCIVKELRPKYLFWHDLLDGQSVNPHEIADPFMNVMKHDSKANNILEEIGRAAKFVDTHAPKDVENIVIPSNHDDFLRRWMNTTDWRYDPVNAKFYLETALEMVEQSNMDDEGAKIIHPFPLWLKRLAKHKKIRCLARDQSFTIRGIEIGQHGDRGSNGSRGSMRGFSKLGVKTIIGHSHTPGIEEGCYQVGTSSRLNLNYNIGPSSWLNTHCVIYPNGKRTLINVINGRWRLSG